MKNQLMSNVSVKTRLVAATVLVPLLGLFCGGTVARAQLDPTAFTSLGTLTAGTGNTVTIDTSAGTITITGPGATSFAGVTQPQGVSAGISVFDFTSINITAGATVVVTGANPLALLSRGTASVLTTIDASGGAGGTALGSTTAGTAVFGGGNGGAGASVINTPAGNGTSTLNGNGGVAVAAPDSTVGNQDGSGGGQGGPGGNGGATGGSATGVSPLTTLVGGGGGSGGPFRTVTTDGPENGAGGGAGGGAIEIVASGALTVSSLTTNGGDGGGFTPVDSGLQYGGGGAGGALVLSGSSLTVTGSLDANGGPAVAGTGAGSGGGGEVALINTPSWVLGSTTALGGLGIDVNVNRGVGGSANGTAGTIEAQTLGVTAPGGQTATFNGSVFTNVIPVQTQAAATPAITVTLGANLILDGGNMQFTGTAETFGPANTFAITSNGGTVDTQGFSDTVSSTITGTGNLTKIGSGTLTLPNPNSYSGGTTLSGGTLIVGNSTALGTGGFSQSAGTALQTDGTNHIITVGNGVNGFDQTGGALVLTLNGAPGAISNDQVRVTGTATLNGNLVINYTPLTAASTATYIVMTTTAGFTGPAASGYLTPTLNAGALVLNITGAEVGNDFDVTITSSQGSFLFAGSNLTPNQQAVAAYLNRFAATATGPVGSLVKNLDIVSVDPAAFGGALNQLMPLNFARFTSSTAFNGTDFLVEQMDNYFAGQRGPDGAFLASKGGIDYSGLTVNDPDTAQGLQEVRSHLLAWNPAPSTGLLSDSPSSVLGGVDMKDTKAMRSQEPANLWNVFVAGDVVLGQDFSDPETGLAHEDSTTGGVRLGADYAITPHIRVGALFDYSHTEATLDAQNSTAIVDTYMPGVYASYAENGWFANAIGTYGFSSYSQGRSIAIAGFDGTANSSPSGDEVVGNLDGGYDFHSGRWTFGPTAGLKYVHMTVDGYTESGLPGANLDVNRDEANSLRSRVGGRVSYVFHSAGLIFTPHLDANWQHEFLDPSRGITSQFDGVNAGTFDVVTQDPSRESALVTLGMDAQVDQALTVFANYTVEAGQDDYFGQSVQAGVKIGF
jgi:uncharacterized protein with beta-barrel porin domain